jgi:uncharacterized protein (DUF433 family)
VTDFTKIINVIGGKPCIRDTRITVKDILSWLASGMSKEDILEDFPELQEEDITAAINFAKNHSFPGHDL